MIHSSFAQQYGWKIITANLPGFYKDTVIINGGTQTWTLHGLLLAPLYDLGFLPRPAQNGFAGGKDGHLVQNGL
jgi:hypothetical protein